MYTTTINPSKRRFSFVLGSGGVKSVAGLGALQVLEEAGLRPSAVVGCSAGAIFGAPIAAGHSAQAALAMTTALWTRDITSQRRSGAWLKLAAPRLTGFDEGFSLRGDSLINQRLFDAFGDTQIESLALPFQVQATCAHSGEGVVLRRGSLVTALRASLALPFLFAPQPLAGRLLVDGSLSDPLPIAAAPEGDVVVALGFKVPHPQRLSSASRLATRVTATLSNNLLASRLAAADTSRLVLMMPELERRVGLFDTDAMPHLFDLGRRAAVAALPRLLQLLGRPPSLQLACA
jgi:NTE family protein